MNESLKGAPDKQLQTMVAHALAQGWTVVPVGSQQLHWKHPDGVGQAFTPARVRPGRDLNNLKSKLVRLGLRLDPESQPPIQKEPDVTRTDEALSGAIDKMPAFPAHDGIGIPAMMNYLSVVETAAKQLLKDMNKTEQMMMTEAERLVRQVRAEARAFESEAKDSTRRLAKAEAELANIKAQLRELTAHVDIEHDRANKAEAKLRMFREAFKED